MGLQVGGPPGLASSSLPVLSEQVLHLWLDELMDKQMKQKTGRWAESCRVRSSQEVHVLMLATLQCVITQR